MDPPSRVDGNGRPWAVVVGAQSGALFVAGTASYELAANQLGVQPDWSAAVAAAGRAGDGFGPLRGFRRRW